MSSHVTKSFLMAGMLFLPGLLSAQLMTFESPVLTSGQPLDAGSSYRFSNVSSGLDAIVTIDALSQMEVISIDAESNISNDAWTPNFVGTGGEGLHYADFSVIFYASGTNTPSSPSQFSTAVCGNDLSGSTDSFMMEFVQVTGFTSIMTMDESLQSLTYADGSQLAMASNGSDPWLAAWQYDNKPGYSVRFGWQGDNGAAEGRSFDVLVAANGSNATATMSRLSRKLSIHP